jgi:hypothetical protein
MSHSKTRGMIYSPNVSDKNKGDGMLLEFLRKNKGYDVLLECLT